MADKHRNIILAIVAKEDPTRYRSRTVLPEKGKGSKKRPRNKKVVIDTEYSK